MEDNLYIEHLLELGFEKTADSLIFDYTNKYGTTYRIIYEGYAWVLYQEACDDEICIQDFRNQKEFTTFFKILSRNSLSDY